MPDLRDAITDEFQYTVENTLFRNKSILDQITKFQDSCSRVNRNIIKATTQCGCIKINSYKQKYPENISDISIEKLKVMMDKHISGELCENCRDAIEKEIGKNLFYLASLCNTLNLNLYDIIIKELERINMLGNFMLR
ncbi:nucleoside triphosphate pyrophosphohydrolase family protein [Defluviitalea phaphyphila]|uniref:hypothetical protein n=1 Tax=Defluviitalea phaphyphila TaxID=1473580 RepID=UPI0007314368|nr:hypothetical protein [Defluviitalea phaphyphila]